MFCLPHPPRHPVPLPPHHNSRKITNVGFLMPAGFCGDQPKTQLGAWFILIAPDVHVPFRGGRVRTWRRPLHPGRLNGRWQHKFKEMLSYSETPRLLDMLPRQGRRPSLWLSALPELDSSEAHRYEPLHGRMSAERWSHGFWLCSGSREGLRKTIVG